tara:strand:+ start:773 stop:1633 length:861 start_codon:yes stop_codon:yes gene_type:complete
MIKYIRRQDLDIAKYNDCIEDSIQSRIYAFSWYLDIVADNWDVMVLDDYKAVMPIPWKSKYRLKYIGQPYFCQQLGVFSKEKFTKEIQEEIIKKIPKKFVKVSLNFNSNNFLTSNMKPLKNYILTLNNTYDTLFKAFSKGRKHAVKVGQKNQLLLNKTTITELIDIKKEFYAHGNFPVIVLEKLTNYVLENNKGFILGVFKDGNLLGGGLFLKSKNRITYLFSSFNMDGRKLQAASFLISNIVKQYENSNVILDFEGGNLPNIGSFFKSFSSKDEGYSNLNYINII